MITLNGTIPEAWYCPEMLSPGCTFNIGLGMDELSVVEREKDPVNIPLSKLDSRSTTVIPFGSLDDDIVEFNVSIISGLKFAYGSVTVTIATPGTVSTELANAICLPESHAFLLRPGLQSGVQFHL
jgi:hypothetical protein